MNDSGGKQLYVLVLAPHPFLQNRGTPMDVHLLLKSLSERNGISMDVIVYPEGENVFLPNVTLYRVPTLININGIRPGFSLKKLYIDFFMFFYTWKMVHKNRYDLIHAGEESVFIAMIMKWIYKIPYVYDLDSSIAQQLVEQHPKLLNISRILNWLEGRAIRGALANAPVCNALSELCEKNNSAKTITLHDISQLKNPDLNRTKIIRKEINAEGLILLYCGNLEAYQGIDLLLESFQYVMNKTSDLDLVIIGGVSKHIEFYRNKAIALCIGDHVHFLGPIPIEKLDHYLADADILVAPRIKGVNTPMKIFPFMHSGKPVLLTNRYTHTQLVTKNEVYLAKAEPEAFARAILELAGDPELRERLGKNGRAFVEKEHVYSAHKKRVDSLYDWIMIQLTT
jgi:glycosyltransferase involved in cell wall biosynthesis